MGSLFEWITDWIKEGLIDAITGQYTSIFNSVNNQVADVANQVGQTPQGWNGGVFSMIQNLSETVVIPIAGMILTFVLVYELIQMILEKNNMHEFDTFNIFKWIFKTFVATYLLTNCFTIVMAVFDVAQNVVSQSAGVINGNLDVQAALSDLKTQLEAMGMWELIGLWLETNIINLCMWVLSIVIFVIVYNKKRGCSVENQKLVLNDFLSDKPDFVVYDTYIDNGATGTNFHRPGFQQMLSDIEAGHINCVIVKDLSRLGRNSIDTGYYIEQYFHAHNVRFIAVTDQFDTADSGNLHGGIMLPLKNMINEAYALDIGRKIKAQARQAMKDGDYIGARAPYGYRKDPDNCHKLLIDENTAPVVKQIFEWAHEHVALNRIVRNLNEMGIPAPSHYKKTTGEITSPGLIGSGKWQTRTVMKILESEVYTGDLVQGKTKIVDHQQVKAGEDNLIIAKCTHEPIISHELFHAVQEYRKQICEESKATPKRPYTPNIFKGKVFCADCGRNLHRQRAERRKGPDTYWFHCLTNSRVEKDSCKGAMIQEKELISTVTAILEKELTVALGMSLPLFQLEARQKQEKDKLKIQMSAKRQEIEKIRRLIRGLYENFVQGILTNDEYFELKADYEHAINALSGEIEVFEKSMDSLDNQLARYRAMEKDAKTLAQDHVLTAELIERLIERIEIDHERNIHVTFRFKNEFQGKAVEPCATM